MRDQRRRDIAVVGEQVALRETALREEDLVEIRELEDALAAPDLGLDRQLATHLLGLLVLAEALVGGRAQPAVVRPLGELDLADEPRLDPDDVVAAHLRHLRDEAERRARPLERPELLEELVDLLLREARADVADVLEAVLAADSEDERAERPRPPSLPARVAGDDELLAAVHLDLQPVARAAARLVARARLLGDDALELLRRRRLLQAGPVVESLREEDGAVPAVEKADELLAPLLERAVDDRRALDLEDVEHVVDDRPASLLHRGEARAALFVERADLAVEDAVRSLDRRRQRPRDVLEARREVVPVPADEPRLAPAHVRERAVTVELDLEAPALPGGHVLGERGQHRRILGAFPARFRRRVVALSENEPVLLLAGEVGRNERPHSLQALAVEADGQTAVGLLLEKLVRARIPDLDRPRPVLALGDLALEAGIVERVVLDVDGEVALAGLERHTLRHRPGEKDAVALEPEVVVKGSRVVALNDEDRALRALLPAPERLRGLLLVALALVVSEARHGANVYPT